MMLPTNHFPASYDKTTRLLSIGLGLVMIALAVFLQSTWVSVLSLAGFALGYAFSARAYEVTGREIRVLRPIGDVVAPLEGIQQARRATPEDFRGCLRLWGSGGLFGYYGLYRTSTLGVCKWYLTNRANAVVITAGGTTTLFSPDDVPGFLAAVERAAPVAANAEPLLPEAITGSYGQKAVLAVAGGLVITFGVIAAALLYSPGPPRYTLTRDALSIHDRFYPVTLTPDSVDVDHVRTVDFGRNPEWRPTWRTNGFSIAHYHAGWFRVAGGGSVRMYRANARSLVLLPLKGNHPPVLLEVDAPDQFVQQLRSEWRGQ